MYVGYWSHDCEMWFEKRLKEIRDHTATLRNCTDWKSTIRLNKDARMVAKKNEQFAASRLKDVLFRKK
jgi:hypothetical protein